MPAMRILLVEDHDLLAGTLTLALRSRGIETESMNGPTPDAVVAAARRLAPVTVLLDLDLGALGSGRDLVRPLTEAGGQVVMLTGVTDEAKLAACVEAGATGVLTKTVPFEELLDTIGRLAAGDSLLTAHQRDQLARALQERRSERAPFATLSPREQSVLARLVDGEPADLIAERSYVSLATVRSQIRSILLKLGVNSQLEAVALARRLGWPEIHQL